MDRAGEKRQGHPIYPAPHDEPGGIVTSPAPSIADLGMDPEVEDRLLPHLDSFVKWELLRFLHDNPEIAATVEDLARYMGRDETELKPAARALAGAGLFRQVEGDSCHAYSLTADAWLRSLIGHLIEGFLADRLVRLAISSHILSARRRARLAGVMSD